MYNNTISGTATEKSCCARDSIIVDVVLYCIYIIITSFFSCWARDSIIVDVILYCNMYNNTISGTATEEGDNDNIITV
jgi:hypothetical protein